MSQEARNTAILQEAYRLWADTKGGSVDHWLSIMADEIDFGSLAMGRVSAVEFTKQRYSPEGVESYLRALTNDWEMINYVVDHFVGQGDRVVMLGRTAWRYKANGRAVDTPKVDAWRFNADGKAVEFFEYYDTAAMFEAVRD
ncbi:nuclear transport factor 2 family protein [Methylocystis echinoides]|uniref:nuclear transport factor 2 family protein n=1 Tax=Methylocystis echinoides TaxID=29468 RepID=UPI00344A1F0C